MKSPHLLQKAATYTNIHRGAERFRRTRRAVIMGVLVIGMVLSGAVVGPGLAEELPGADGDAATSSLVEFTCNDVRVSPPDAETSYDLVVHYVDTTTGMQGKALIGPFTGTFEDDFGKTDFVITEVEVRYDHGGGASGTIPARCQ